ncbi:hypothetical protein [Legionella bozemanae]|uniref:hypothetical protein n=1 Tax=Legionella bozemanae TaxID=447 RepID=UPI001040F9C9|nr:hypothetical protein [Legionella bozemanae]
MITDNQKCYKTTTTQLHWSAIIAGAFVGVGLGFLLNIFSMAIGLSAYSAGPNGATTVALGGVLGLLIGVIVSMGVAGFVAGYLARFYHCYCHGGVIYGFITWSLALMLSVLLIMPMTHYVAFHEENLNPALTPTQISAADVNVSVTPQQNAPAEKMTNANPKHLAWSGWILFILFFLGALSSCISACYGMRCKKEEQGIPL